MIVTNRIAIRIALILLVAVILQTSFFSYLSILGATPNVLPVVVVTLGLLGGAVVGAVGGFAAGLLLDSILLQTLGVSSLVLLSVGYLAGRHREGAPITNALLPPTLIAGFTMLAGAGLAAVELMLGVDAAVSLLVVREIVLQALFAGLLAFPLYPLIRFILRPALVDYAPAKRGRMIRLGGRRRPRGAHGRRVRSSAARHVKPRIGRAA
jgi:rod shape-determining protein MreD